MEPIKLILTCAAVGLAATIPVISQAQPIPTIVTESPSPGASNIAANADIVVEFSEEMDVNTIDYQTFVVSSAWRGVLWLGEGSYTFHASDKIALFNPGIDFAPGEVVSVVLTTGIKSALGVPLAMGFCWNFTVVVGGGYNNFVLDASYPLTSSPEFRGPAAICAADFNNDGWIDLATADGWDGPPPGPPTVAILFNDGTGKFPKPAPGYGAYDGGFRIHSMATGDFNGDGWPDLAAANSHWATVTILMNDGTGAFPTHAHYAIANSGRGVTVGDFDNDGDADVAAVGWDLVIGTVDNMSVLLNTGGVFSSPIVYSASTAGETKGLIEGVTAADFNGDGFLDLATGTESFYLKVFLNDATGTGMFLTPVPGIDTKDQYGNNGTNGEIGFAAADFNNDEKMDIVVTPGSSGGGILSVMTNQSPVVPLLSGHSWYTQVGTVRFPVAGDFDADGDQDFFMVYNPYKVIEYCNRGDATFEKVGPFASGPMPIGFTVADFDADGDLDVAHVNGDLDPLHAEVSVLFNVAPFNPGTCYNDPVTISGVKFYDENGNSVWDQTLPETVLPYCHIELTGTTTNGPISPQIVQTDAQGEYTFGPLLPGSYQVKERLDLGAYSSWAQTFPLSVFHTVDNVAAGTHVTGLDFGNDQCDSIYQGPITTVTCLHGTADNFVGPEPSFMSQGLHDYLYNTAPNHAFIDQFDQPADDQWFGHTFDGCFDPDKCLVVGAKLRISLRASGGQPSTDWLALGDYNQAGGRIWSITLSDLAAYWSSPWPGTLTGTLDLADLPGTTWLPSNILANLQDGDLDIVVSDDTEVDFIELEITICCRPCDDLHEDLNTGYDNVNHVLLNPGDNDNDWQLVATESPSKIVTPVSHVPAVVTSAPGDGLQPPARWIGLPNGAPQDHYNWFEYEFCLDNDFEAAGVIVNSGQANDSLWLYLNNTLIAGPYGPADPISFSYLTPGQTPPFKVGRNKIQVRINTDPSPTPSFILNGYIEAVHGECCDTGACCDCDLVPDCYVTDEMTCLKGKGAFHPNTTCDLIDCDEACFASGDINDDGIPLTVGDLTYLIRFVNFSGPAPYWLYEADLNGDCHIDQLDVDILSCYLSLGYSCFANGYPVLTCCCPDTMRGACCAGATDDCSILAHPNCQAISHYYQGDGIPCTPNPCLVCCINGRGNANGDALDKVNISDVTYLLAYLFGIPSGPPPPCKEEANANGDLQEKVNVSDATYLLSYLFGIPSGPPPPACP